MSTTTSAYDSNWRRARGTLRRGLLGVKNTFRRSLFPRPAQSGGRTTPSTSVQSIFLAKHGSPSSPTNIQPGLVPPQGQGAIEQIAMPSTPGAGPVPLTAATDPRPSTTAFTRRQGTHVFRLPTPTNGWSSLVNHWHKQVYHSQDIEYQYQAEGPAHMPTWIATPKSK